MRHRSSLFRYLGACVAAYVWTRRGRRALARGEVGQAVVALEQAVSWRPGAFKPLLLLAQGYLRARETYRAHRTLAQAREADPARFARIAPAWLAREGVDPATLGRVLAAGLSGTSARPAAPTATQTWPARRRAVEAKSLPYGDCRSLDEYARFQAMPPISAAELESVDWDEVLADLLED